MSVGDSAEELTLIHALLVGRERSPALSVVSAASPQNFIFCPLEDDREFLSLFPHTSRPLFFYSRPVGGRHTSP